jgi:hypothetical protein
LQARAALIRIKVGLWVKRVPENLTPAQLMLAPVMTRVFACGPKGNALVRGENSTAAGIAH